MEYTPTVWVEGQPPALDAENLNKIEAGIETLSDEVNNTKKIFKEEMDNFIFEINKNASMCKRDDAGKVIYTYDSITTQTGCIEVGNVALTSEFTRKYTFISGFQFNIGEQPSLIMSGNIKFYFGSNNLNVVSGVTKVAKVIIHDETNSFVKQYNMANFSFGTFSINISFTEEEISYLATHNPVLTMDFEFTITTTSSVYMNDFRIYTSETGVPGVWTFGRAERNSIPYTIL